MAVVVRCPGCRGAARVGPEAVGLLVVCPSCQTPFLAIEEAVAVPRPARSRPRQNEYDTPPAPLSSESDPPVVAEAAPATGGLPVSVMVGLALLPFTIPLVWLIAPLLVGHAPALSLAAPAALAVSASVLCLAVVYTVDWTGATRLKGVAMLVGLAYLTGLSLYFLKPGMVEWAERRLGHEHDWVEFRPPGENCRVDLPAAATATPDRPLPGWKLTCHKASHREFKNVVVYVVGVGLDAQAGQKPEAWFDAVGKTVASATRDATVIGNAKVLPQERYPGREWEIRLPDGVTTRFVRVFRCDGRIYYLSAEGEHLRADDPLARTFFASFLVTPAAE